MASLLDPPDGPVPVDDFGRPMDVGSFLDRLRQQQTPTDPIWPVSNPIGTEGLVDYRGYDQPTSAPGLPPDALARALAPAPNTEYGSVLPIARDTGTGDLRLALPSGMRDFLLGGYDLSQGPRTGTVTPEGTMSLLGAVDPLARPQEGLLGSLRVPTRAGNIARVDVRGPGNVLQDVRPMTGRAIGSLLDEHLAAGGVDLYGGRGSGPADVTVTLPPGVTRAGDIATRGQQMVDQATGMTQNVPAGVTPPRYWYQAGAEALHGATGQDLEATQRLTAAHAITSPQTDVAGNSQFAVNAWNQALLGEPIAVTNAQRNAALEDTLYGGALPATRKTGPFYENHMRNLDPTIANNLTNDIWQMRQAGFAGPKGEPYSATPGVGEDNYVRMMVDRATRQLNADGVDGGGWTPEQVQAALWVHAKTLQETGQATPASFNFKDALERLQAGQANAHQAGPALLGSPGAASPQAQDAFGQAARGLLTDPLGRDIVNSSLGLLTPPGAPGAAAVAMTTDGIKPASRQLMDASTLIRATLLRQPSALWTAHPDVTGLPTYANANVVHAFSGNPADHALAIRDALDNAGGGLEHTVLQQTPAGVRVLNIGERTGLANPDFQAAVKDAISNAGLPADLKRARADYGYFTHDWTADPTGASYIAQLAQLPPHLQRVGDQLFAGLGGRLDAAGSAISGRSPGAGGLPGGTGPWTVPGFAQAVGPQQPLTPVWPWQRRPTPADPASNLVSLLRGAGAPGARNLSLLGGAP
jgi:hypothetical protein